MNLENGAYLMRIRGLSQVGMTVKDLKLSLKFYVDVLGLPILSIKDMPSKVIEELYDVKEGTKVKFAILRTGWGTMIELFEFTPPKADEKIERHRPGMTHIALDVGNIRRAKKRLEKDGVEVISDVLTIEGTEVLFVKDPDGHLVELIDLGIVYYVNRYIGSLMGRIINFTKYRDIDKI
jgi:catechol 2,3-dioxygenase-like lactoylglutathione lyase family enzyme